MEQRNSQSSTNNIQEENGAKNSSRPSTTSSIIRNNFFQVTINSEKLSDLFSNINEVILQQNRRIQNFSKDMQSKYASLQNKIQAQFNKNNLLFTKLDLKIGQSSNTQHCYLMDVHKKSQARDLQLGQKIQALNSKIGRVQDTAKDDLMNGLVYLKKQIIGDFVANVESSHDQNDGPIGAQQAKQQNKQYKKVDFNYLRSQFEAQISKLRQDLKSIFNQYYQMKQSEKRKKHAQNMIQLTYRRQKNDLSNQTTKNDQNYLKIVYPSSSKKTVLSKQNQVQPMQSFPKIGTKFTRHMSFTKFSGTEQQIINNYRQMAQKLLGVDKILNEHNNIISDCKNKQIVMDQKLMILNRKFQKLGAENVQLKNHIRRVQNHKIDDKVIEQLRNYIKWGIRQLQQKVSKKCSDEDLSRQKNRLSQKISILHQNLIQKADKSQIQKALLFLQGKIKEIIFLIAAEQTQQRQGAIMKTAAKCLSCDKQVQRQIQSQLKCRRQISKISQGQYMKSMTHRVRQRYRKQVGQNLTTGNETFDE